MRDEVAPSGKVGAEWRVLNRTGAVPLLPSHLGGERREVILMGDVSSLERLALDARPERTQWPLVYREVIRRLREPE